MTYEESMYWRSNLQDADDVEAEALREDEMAKHTPGPWYAITRQGSWDWLVARDSNNEICQMFHDGTEFNETGEANARLVAAAPELLAALKAIESTYVFLDSLTAGTEPQHTNTVRALKLVRAAIAKAEAA